MVQLDDFYGPNAGYAAELLEREQAQADAIVGLAAPTLLASDGLDAPQLSAASAAASLAQGIRLFGHRGAQLDSLRSEPPASSTTAPMASTSPPCRAARERRRRTDHAQETSARHRRHPSPRTIFGTSGYEFARQRPAERVWLLEAVDRSVSSCDPSTDAKLLIG